MPEPAVPASDSSKNDRRGRVLLIGTAAVALVMILLLQPASHFAPSNAFNAGSTGTLVSYNYTCCRAPMINTIYRPGELISARWIQATDAEKSTQPASIVLSMKLSGPYRSVILLKLSFRGSSRKKGYDVRRCPTDHSFEYGGGQPLVNPPPTRDCRRRVLQPDVHGAHEEPYGEWGVDLPRHFEVTA